MATGKDRGLLVVEYVVVIALVAAALLATIRAIGH
jgi:Flp pilus assembly pilin Flp